LRKSMLVILAASTLNCENAGHRPPLVGGTQAPGWGICAGENRRFG